MKALMLQLYMIAEATQKRLRTSHARGVGHDLEMIDYHGFFKARFPGSFLQEIQELIGIDPELIQLELVHVGCDLTQEIHLHREATALTVCMGPDEGFPEPRFASAFLSEEWRPVQAGEVIEIPAGTPHGFTVEDGGCLHFLSVQSPPIARGDGHDDYVRLM